MMLRGIRLLFVVTPVLLLSISPSVFAQTFLTALPTCEACGGTIDLSGTLNVTASPSLRTVKLGDATQYDITATLTKNFNFCNCTGIESIPHWTLTAASPPTVTVGAGSIISENIHEAKWKCTPTVSSTVPGDWQVTFYVQVTYTFKTGVDENGNDLFLQDQGGNVISATFSDSATCQFITVGVQRIEANVGGAGFQTITDTLRVPQGAEVTFKAIPTPNVAWPTGQPVWSGATRDADDFALAARTFDEVSSGIDVTASCGTSSKTVSVVVVPTLLTMVKFFRTKDQTVFHDGTDLDYDPHWLDNSIPPNGNADDQGDAKNPICYTRNTKATISSAVWTLETGTTVPPNVKIRGIGEYCNIPATDAVVTEGNLIALLDTESTTSFPNEVMRIEKMSINWQISFDSGTTWINAGKSENECFITLVDPPARARDRTTLYHACRNGGTTPKSCLEKTWSSFSGTEVKKWDYDTKGYNMPLYYYGTLDGGENKNTEKLLTKGDGQCGAWVCFFQNCLLVNGIESKIIEVKPANNDYSEFAVKNINFPAISSYPLFPYWKYSDAAMVIGKDTDGLKGQNNKRPREKLFAVHLIVRPSITLPAGVPPYYDPSYGITTTSADDYTSQIVAAWRHSTKGRWSKAEWWKDILKFTDQ